MGVRLEVPVDSLESALAARDGGADRIELCGALSEGGLTPSLGLIEAARAHLSIPIHVMIRPRAGDFCYSELELVAMRRDVQLAQNAGCNGVVFGFLNTDGSIDADRTKLLLDAARPLSVTFHRAFDLTPDPLEALQTLIELGADRVLTSGQAGAALEGVDLISELVKAARGRIIVMPGGGVEQGLEEIVQKSGVREVHLSARKTLRSPVQTQTALEGSLGTRQIADGKRIAQIKSRLARL